MVPRQLVLRHALLLGRDDVAGQHRQHRAVHRHRHRHLVQRDAVEQDLHVLDRVDGHAGLADVAGDARMVAVVAAVGRQVEGHRDALPAAGQRPCDRTRSTPRRWRSRRTGGWSRAAPRTSWPAGRAGRARSRAACRRGAGPPGPAAVYSGLTVMPSGVTQFEGRRGRRRGRTWRRPWPRLRGRRAEFGVGLAHGRFRVWRACLRVYPASYLIHNY